MPATSAKSPFTITSKVQRLKTGELKITYQARYKGKFIKASTSEIFSIASKSEKVQQRFVYNRTQQGRIEVSERMAKNVQKIVQSRWSTTSEQDRRLRLQLERMSPEDIDAWARDNPDLVARFFEEYHNEKENVVDIERERELAEQMIESLEGRTADKKVKVKRK